MNHLTWGKKDRGGARRRLMVLVLACILCTVVISTSSEGQDFAGFRGRIVDPSGAAVSGAGAVPETAVLLFCARAPETNKKAASPK